MLKDFNQSKELKTIAKKSLHFTCSSHRISVLLRLRRDSVIRKLARVQGINIDAAFEKIS